MEWQAGYISGAILMPASAISCPVKEYCEPQRLFGAVGIASEHARILIQSVKLEYQVSEESSANPTSGVESSLRWWWPGGVVHVVIR